MSTKRNLYSKYKYHKVKLCSIRYHHMCKGYAINSEPTKELAEKQYQSGTSYLVIA